LWARWGFLEAKMNIDAVKLVADNALASIKSHISRGGDRRLI